MPRHWSSGTPALALLALAALVLVLPRLESWADSCATATPVTYSFIDISGTGTATLPGSDDGTITLSAGNLGGFTFPFYGQSYSSLSYSVNGLITFGGANSAFSNTDLSSSPSQAAIAVFWDDLLSRTTDGQVYWQVLGSGASQQLVIQWNLIGFFSGGLTADPLTFQAILNADGSIQFNYQDLVSGTAAGNNGASATVGIKNSACQTADRLVLAFNNGPNQFVGTGQSTLVELQPNCPPFTPPPPPVCYAASPIPFDFTDISGTGTATLPLSDDGTVTLTAANLNGFTFPFYDQNYSSLSYNMNGLIAFGGANSDFSNTDLSSSPSQAAIAVFWDDLFSRTTDGRVYWQVLGSGASQQLVIQWNLIGFFSDGLTEDPLTFQAILNADGSIQFNYHDLVSGTAAGNNGASATVGIKNNILHCQPEADRLLLAFNNGPNQFVGTGQSTVITRCPTTTTVDATTVQYSDRVTLKATVSPALAQGSVQFIVDGIPAGGFVAVNAGVAELQVQNIFGASSHTIQAFFTSNGQFSSSSGSSTLTVTREDANVVPDATNPSAVKVNAAGGTAGPIVLKVSLTELQNGPGQITGTTDALGDICKASPVSVTLTPLIGGSTLTVSSAALVSCDGTTRKVQATFNNVPVNVYQVSFSIGGTYYTGTATSVLTVYDPSLGFVTGGGALLHSGVRANFGYNVKYLKNGQIQGSLLYIEHRAAGDVVLKSNAMGALAIVGNTGVITGKATLSGAGNYGFQATGVDNGEPGRNDRFGLKVTNPAGAVVGDLTFGPLTLTGGNLQVPH